MVERAAARPESGALPRCPACGKSVDPLRAGPVAILGDGFHHYCDDACKRTHVRTLHTIVGDVPRADPPPVVAVPSSEPLPSQEREMECETEPTHSQAVTVDAESDPAALEDGPLTLRSPAPPASGLRPVQAARGPLSLRRALDIASLGGLVAGLLAAGVGLAGAGADPAPLPMAALGCVVVVGCAAMTPREAADVHPAMLVGPVVFSLVAALWARLVDDP